MSTLLNKVKTKKGTPAKYNTQVYRFLNKTTHIVGHMQVTVPQGNREDMTQGTRYVLFGEGRQLDKDTLYFNLTQQSFNYLRFRLFIDTKNNLRMDYIKYLLTPIILNSLNAESKVRITIEAFQKQFIRLILEDGLIDKAIKKHKELIKNRENSNSEE